MRVGQSLLSLVLLFVLVGVISWIAISGHEKNDPLNHTNQHEQDTNQSPTFDTVSSAWGYRLGKVVNRFNGL